jgi:hypothetical protein
MLESKTDPDSPEAGIVIDSGMCGLSDASSCPTTGLSVEHGLTPDALRVLHCLKSRWPTLQSFAGVGERPSNVDRDHQEGRAVDAMIPNYDTGAGHRIGGTIARWAVNNHQSLGIKYVIWNAQIWNVEREHEGWRACGTSAASCYTGPNDTAAHRDYVLTARFGQCSSHWANCHTGLDFAAPPGVPIRATMSGTVTFAGLGAATESSPRSNTAKVCKPGMHTNQPSTSRQVTP